MAHRAIENSRYLRICYIYADYELIQEQKTKTVFSVTLRCVGVLFR